MRIPALAVAVVAAAIATAAVSLPWSGTLKGLSLDSLVWLRQSLFGPQYERQSSPAVVVAIDEETYRREPFQSTPKVLWTNELATVIDAVIDAGAGVVGFDLILPTSAASRIKGIDRTFLQSLRKHSRQGRLVLSKVQHSLKPILPAPGQRFAVGHNRNIRAANLYTDAEGIVRGVPLAFGLSGEDGQNRFEPSLASELAQRALGDRLSFDAEGHAIRDGVPVPTVGGNNLLINFDDNQSGIPTYSLADLHACAAVGDTEFFRQHFAGKIVLLGAVLDVEDRKISSLRYATVPDAAAFGDRCREDALPGLLSDEIVRDSLPGVYVHAFAANNLVRGNFLVQPAQQTAAFIVFVLALAAAVAAMRLSATVAGVAAAAGTVAWVGAAALIFERGFAVPLYEPPIAAAIAFALLTGYRFTIADRDERRLRQMFGLYLAPSVIEQMVDHGEMPVLGGETRDLSVYFSDLAGFTSFSEGMSPDELVKLLNNYLSAMTEIVEDHGGFVDKYIGDAIVAVFGAPQEDFDHAGSAVAAALACQQRLVTLNSELGLSHAAGLQQRIGINTGRILVGNIGSRRRFNYTVMGDAVNLASRLEGANKAYGTEILVSGQTMQSCDLDIVFREIDRVRVVGRNEPVDLYEPLGLRGEVSDAPQSDAYVAALNAYRAGDFDRAVEMWSPLEQADRVAAAMLGRARQFSSAPPPAWDGVYNLDSK